ncbi:MAG: hypothetical protein OXH66_14375 [Gemmatimonadetes bacterium]|nr:hypothetical protein [Gemmatimonadota bacterium]
MTTLQVDRQNSFARGMRDSAAPTEYAPDEVETLLNGRPSRVGNSIEPRGGSKRTHAAEINDGEDGLGAIEYRAANRTQHFVVVVGNTWYHSTDQGETWTAIAGATNYQPHPWSLVLMRVGAENRVIGANGGVATKPVSWNGDGAVTTLDNWPNGIRHLAVFNDRLFGSDGTITVLGSKVSDPSTLDTEDGGLSIQCQAHDDDPEITGLWTHGVVLLVFKRRSMGYIEGFGFNTISVQTGDRGLSRSVGCIAHRSIAPAGDGGVCWLSDRGVEYLPPGGLSPQLVSQPIQAFMDTIDYAGIASNPGLPCALWWQRREEYWLAVPSGSATENTHIICFRPGNANRPHAVWLFQSALVTGGTFEIDADGILQYRDDTTANRVRLINGVLELDPLTGTFVEIDEDGILQLASIGAGAGALFVADRGTAHERPHMVGYDGFVRELETGGMDDVLSDGSEGSAIEAKVRSRPFIYGDPLRNKRPVSVRLSALPESPTANVSVRLLGDGEQLSQRTVQIVRRASTRPRPTRARMGGKKASAIQVEVNFHGHVTLQAVEAVVRLLDEVP